MCVGIMQVAIKHFVFLQDPAVLMDLMYRISKG